VDKLWVLRDDAVGDKELDERDVLADGGPE
jgi:hypothetical protein